MTRISRISTPRATLAAFALLVVVMTGFGLVVDGIDSMAAQSQVANETVEPETGPLQHCWLPDGTPLVPPNRRARA